MTSVGFKPKQLAQVELESRQSTRAKYRQSTGKVLAKYRQSTGKVLQWPCGSLLAGACLRKFSFSKFSFSKFSFSKFSFSKKASQAGWIANSQSGPIQSGPARFDAARSAPLLSGPGARCRPCALRFSRSLGALNRHSCHIRGSIVVSISACHAEDPGSIPGRGVLPLWERRRDASTRQRFRLAKKNFKA